MYDNNDDNQVNTEVEDNVYYNYEEPVKKEKKRLFKRIFKGKKRVVSSDDLGVQENFYGDGYQKTEQQPQAQQVSTENVSQEVVQNNYQAPPQEDYSQVSNNYNDQYNQYNNNNNQPQNNMTYQNEDATEEVTMDYGYVEPEPQPVPVPFQPMQQPSSSKKGGYAAIGLILIVGVVILVINLLSKASEKYNIDVGFSSITLRSGESYQMPYLTNDTTQTSFKIDDTTVATVNSNGYITAKSVRSGKDYIKATLTIGSDSEKIYKTVTIFVVPTNSYIALENFEVSSEMTINKGERKLIEITDITPPNNTQYAKYRYESANSGVVTVDGGYIYGVSKGTATITVKNTSNNELNKIINVTVK